MAVFAAVPTVNIFGLAQSLLVHAQQVKITKKKQFNFIENIFFKNRNQAVWGLSGLKLNLGRSPFLCQGLVRIRGGVLLGLP